MRMKTKYRLALSRLQVTESDEVRLGNSSLPHSNSSPSTPLEWLPPDQDSGNTNRLQVPSFLENDDIGVTCTSTTHAASPMNTSASQPEAASIESSALSSSHKRVTFKGESLEEDLMSSSQQYTNPAYEAEDSQPELREIESKRDSSTIRDQETNGEPVVQNHEPPRIPTISISKRQSIADIAFTQVKSSSVNREFRASSFIREQLERNRSKFVHPFGNKSTILEILYGGGDEDDLGQAEVEAGSAAKLVIWLVFCCFMIGVAGAIILGAESFAKKLDINNSTLVITSTSASFHADST